MWDRRREVQLDVRAVSASCGNCGRQRPRRVHDDEIAGREERRKVLELRVRYPAVVLAGDHELHLVAFEPACLGRLVRLEAGRQLELQGPHARASTRTSSRAL